SAGEYDIEVNVEGLTSTNYLFKGVKGILTVGQQTVNVEAVASLGDSGKVYGDGDPDLASAFSWGKLPDGITADMFTVSVIRVQGENVGTYDMTADVQVTEVHAKNITLTGSLKATFAITKAKINIYLNPIKLSYGDPVPCPEDYPPTIEGLVKNEELGIDDLHLKKEIVVTYVTDYYSGAPVREGGYGIDIQASFLEEPQTRSLFFFNGNRNSDAKDNYTIQAKDSNLINLGPKDIIIGEDVTFKESSYQKTYSQKDPEYKLLWSNNLAAMEKDFTVTFTREPGETVGTYAIKAEVKPVAGKEGNYNLITDEHGVKSILEIMPLPVLIEAENNQKGYGETEPIPVAQAKITYTQVSNPIENFVKEQLIFTLEREAGEEVKKYAIKVVYQENENFNYKISTGEGIFSILPGTLTVKAHSFTITQGDPMPALTYDIEGFQRGENAEKVLTGQPKLITDYRQGSPAGTYTITLEQGTLKNSSNENYQFLLKNGAITVAEKTVLPTPKPTEEPAATSTPKPETSTPKEENPPRAGDDSVLMVWMILLVVTGVGMIFIISLRRRYERKNK
ncbi:MAG: hypothetical protein GX786_11040, partial [Clostridiales bacterium]|nr:hypothetical protein [Clostridiales bacterium]